ncbi:MAG: hypothetical protein CMH58_04985 [Myxococcales bacterium]|nr:hypothetical protein [Myxococcales bacterium]
MKLHSLKILICLITAGCEASMIPTLELISLRASGRAGACAAQGTPLSTPELRWLHLTMDGPQGRSLDKLTPSNLDTHRLDLDGIPVGEDWTITVNGYRNTDDVDAERAWWRALTRDVATRADEILELDLLFSRVDQPDCARGGPDRGVAFATLTPLADGRALLAGGLSELNDSDQCEGCREGQALRAAWVYDPSTSTFQRTGDLPTPQAGHRAVLTDGGRVLLLGGARRLTLGGEWPVNAAPQDILETAALWDPTTGQWEQLLGAPPRLHHSLNVMGSELIVAGGIDGEGRPSPDLIRLEITNGELIGSQNRRIEMGCPRVGHIGLQRNNEILLFGGEVCDQPQGPLAFKAGQIRVLAPSSWDGSANTFFAGAGRLSDGSYAILGGATRTEVGLRPPSRSSAFLYMPSDNRLLRAPLLPEEAVVLYPSVASVEQGKTVILAGGFRDLELSIPSASIVRYDDRTEASRRMMPLLTDPEGLTAELSSSRGGVAAAVIGEHLVLTGGIVSCPECPGGQGGSSLTELFQPREGP